MTKKKNQKKNRDEVVDLLINNPTNNPIGLGYDFDKETIIVENGLVELSKVESTYLRSSGKEKVTYSIPTKPSLHSFNPEKALSNNYDFLVAVDTNTKVINGTKYSLAVSYILEKRLQSYEDSIPFVTGGSYLFINVDDNINPERLAWHIFISRHMQKMLLKKYRVGLIVDSELGLHESFNKQITPYFDKYKLPSSIQLIYASSDSANDSLVNKMISFCDKLAAKVIKSETELINVTKKKLLTDLPYCEAYTPIFFKQEPN